MTTRGIFGLENIRGRQREGTWVPSPSVFGRDSLQQIGYVVGGADSSDNTVSYYQAISYSSDTRSNVANLPQARAGVYGLASPSNGYAVGGGAGTTGTPGTYYSSSNKLTLSTQTNSALPGVNMSESFGRGGSTGSSTAGYIAGGYSVPGEGNGWSRLEKLTYSTETMARIPGSNLPGRGYGGATGWDQAATANGDLFGIWIAGNVFPSPSSNLTGTQVMRFQFNTDQFDGAVPSWNLAGPGNRLQKAGITASGTGAYVVGGSYPANTIVQKISFSDMTNSVVANSAAPGRTDLTGTGNPSLGYYAGGATGNNANGTGGSVSSIVEKMSYESDTISRVPSLDLANSLAKTGSLSAAADNKTLLPITQTFTGKEASFNFGYSMTGQVAPNSPSQHSTMEVTYKIDYGTDTSANLPSGGVGYGYYDAFGGGNKSAAYKMGGRSNDVPADGSQISEKVVYATDTRQGLPNYGNRRYDSFAVTHGETALYGVGGRGQSSNQIKTDVFKMVYSAETWSAIPGTGDDLAQARRQGASMASSTHGYFAGGGNLPGNPSSPIYRSDVDRMTFSSETTDRIPSANLLGNVVRNRGWSDSTAGYSVGGINDSSTYLSRIEKMTFATDTTELFTSGSLPAPMTEPQTMTAGSTTAYNAGGNASPGGHKSSVAKMSFATGTFSFSGNLPTFQYQGVGASAGSQNLPFQVPPPATPTASEIELGVPEKGYIAGGNPGPLSFVDKLDMKTETYSNVTTLEEGNKRFGGYGSTTNGYFAGSSAPNRTWCQKLVYSTDTISKLSSNLTASRSYLKAIGNNTAGYVGGGTPGPQPEGKKLDKMPYSTETFSNLPNLPAGRYRYASLGNQEKGYFAGGYPTPSRSTVTKITYASDTYNSTPNLSYDDTTFQSGAGNATKGYVVSGEGGGTKVDRLTFSNDTISRVPSANLTANRYGMPGNNSPTKAYFTGGSPGNNSNTHVITFADDTTALSTTADTSTAGRNGYGAAGPNHCGLAGSNLQPTVI